VALHDLSFDVFVRLTTHLEQYMILIAGHEHATGNIATAIHTPLPTHNFQMTEILSEPGRKQISSSL